MEQMEKTATPLSWSLTMNPQAQIAQQAAKELPLALVSVQ
jgi:hypothetical protein